MTPDKTAPRESLYRCPLDLQIRRAKMSQPTREPAINLPPLILILIIANVAVFGGLQFMSDGFTWAVIEVFGFTPERFISGEALGVSGYLSPVTYMFLHGDWLHLGINMVTLAAFGAGIERRLGAFNALSLYLLCGIIAAATHFAIYSASDHPMIGASGGVSGLAGAVVILLRDARRRAGLTPSGSLLGIVFLWAVPMVVLGIVGMPGTNGANIAWVAHLGGFVGGLVLSAVLLAESRK